MRRLPVLLVVLALVAAPAAAKPFPEVIALPEGFSPEGIAVGRGTTFYVGSIPSGAIYRGDLRTGQGGILVEGHQGGSAIGLAYDRGRLFVAGGQTGTGSVYDAGTGALLTRVPLGSGFVNDVVVTKDAAYFTNSFAPELYALELGPGGRPTGDVRTIPLSGAFDFQPGAFNLNGIEATPAGDALLSIQSSTGLLHAIDPTSGAATIVDLDGERLRNGDGLLLQGRTLYVVQNRDNVVAVVRLAPDLASGEVVERLTDPDFDVPTTIARHGSRRYVVNARFGTPSPSTASYSVVLAG